MNKKTILIIQKNNELINRIDFSSLDISNVLYSNNNSGAFYLAIKEKPFLIISDTDVANINANVLLQDIKLRFLNTYQPAMIIISDTRNFAVVKDALNNGVYRFFDYQTPIETIVTAIKQCRDHVSDSGEEKHFLVNDFTHYSKRLLAIINVIQNEYMNNLKVSHVAEELNVSESFVMHTLQRELHKTFKQILKEMRINEAKKLLHTGRYNIKETAHKVGFKDEKYFSTTFKSMTGVSPSSYIDSKSE